MIRPLLIAIVSVCTVVFGGVAAERHLDLRPRSTEKPLLTFASVSPTEKGVLQKRIESPVGLESFIATVAGTSTESAPRCTIRIVTGLPQVDDHLEIPTAAEAAGWRAITKGSTNLTDWSAANTAVHTFFKVIVEQQK